MNEHNNTSAGRHYPPQDRPQRPRGGRYLSEAERLRRKKIRRRQNMIQRGILASVLLAILILIIVLIAKGCSNDRENSVAIDNTVYSDGIIGNWTINNAITYRFEQDGSGAMVLPNSQYAFSFEIIGNKIYIDFEDETFDDGIFAFRLEGDMLILSGEEDSTNDSFELNRINSDE